MEVSEESQRNSLDSYVIVSTNSLLAHQISPNSLHRILKILRIDSSLSVSLPVFQKIAICFLQLEMETVEWNDKIACGIVHTVLFTTLSLGYDFSLPLRGFLSLLMIKVVCEGFKKGCNEFYTDTTYRFLENSDNDLNNNWKTGSNQALQHRTMRDNSKVV